MTEWDAKRYDEVDSLQKWLADKHLARLELEGSERVLDVGCGEGKISAEVAQRLPRGSVLGVDRSTRMISFARAFSQERVPEPCLRDRRCDGAALSQRVRPRRLLQCPALGA